MNTYEIIKELAKKKKISIRQLEMRFGYSNGYLAKWKTNTPNADELPRLADYFGVSVDYLLGREEKTSLAEKHGVFAFDGDPVSDEEVEFLKSVLAAKRAAENK
ncbi:helix-turn-helix transcriptional regulator [Enterococcus avium]|uniref:helix-turn-helix domain-containing protein n=1 Tax=Enterococcus avium TaxID=33945 RepID=UPI00232C8F07|nr:helix-turn-helix transcriptional regulator [Enterococcus avium]MDB1751540.1 helix-turn-helix transcriptional regulator [Enterococcus avium]MDB1755682.1 helix-turn-helix transcriptional regulator [Enterococcus avium]MDB1762760.1 helix-turn-helix transcriptional regulator [Enterococcus avium]